MIQVHHQWVLRLWSVYLSYLLSKVLPPLILCPNQGCVSFPTLTPPCLVHTVLWTSTELCNRPLGAVYPSNHLYICIGKAGCFSHNINSKPHCSMLLILR